MMQTPLERAAEECLFPAYRGFRYVDKESFREVLKRIIRKSFCNGGKAATAKIIVFEYDWDVMVDSVLAELYSKTGKEEPEEGKPASPDPVREPTKCARCDYSEETGLTDLRTRYTARGFVLTEFTDRCGQECSLQKSSLGTESAVWFGVDNTGPSIQGPKGGTNEDVHARMHLTRQQVVELLPLLTHFAANGVLPFEDDPAQS